MRRINIYAPVDAIVKHGHNLTDLILAIKKSFSCDVDVIPNELVAVGSIGLEENEFSSVTALIIHELVNSMLKIPAKEVKDGTV